MNRSKLQKRSNIILDLCGGTGAWSEPYRAAGYDVRLITLPNRDVRDYHVPDIDRGRIRGVLAAPPCTHFSVSGARWWAEKDRSGVTTEAVDIVRACLRIVREASPAWWALENPVGRIARLIPELGEPALSFQPWEFGDPWLKRTLLWGDFTIPQRKRGACKPPYTTGKRWKVSLTNHLSPKPTAAQIHKLVESGMIPPDWVHRLGPCPERATLRSITPPSFARAFFVANP